jgi:murein L,D-transpeptidase YcbB/YkuD
MPGARVERFLASTAVVLLLSFAAGNASAEPKFGSNPDAVAPSALKMTPPPAAGGADQAPAKASEPTGDSAPVSPAVKPEASATPPAPVATAAPEVLPPPSVVAVVKPDAATDRDATSVLAPTAKPDGAATPPPAATPPAAAPQAVEEPKAAPTPPQAAEEIKTPAAIEAPAANPQPAAVGGDEVPVVPAPAAAAPAETAPAAATPAPAVVVDANAPIADQLRELANGKFDRVLGGKKDRAAFDAFYASRNYAPVWITDGSANARAKAAIAYLGHVDADGLDPADYPVPNFTSLTDPAALAEAELKLSQSVATYARHAQTGRVHWSRVSGDILYEVKPSTPAEVLAAMATASDVGAALDGYEPHAPNYLALKEKLAELRAGQVEAGKTAILPGAVLKVGMLDDRVPALRARLHVAGDGTTYDKTLADAVKNFQQEHEQKPTGLLTPQTVQALNGKEPEHPIDTVLANMERWRWMPHELGKDYVIVNLADFTLRVFQNGNQVWMTRIVEGKPEMPTPIMSAEMKFITINPTWNVPPSIVAREYMPALQQDPTVLERMGLRVSTNPDGTVHISQPPGDGNALGRIRFNFPNKFLVYQHDTPNKNLFAMERRAFSHGCMRVQDPVRYAAVLLSIVRPGEGYTEDRIRKMFGSSEADIQFPHFLPVHLTYQTAFVDENGKLEFRDDVYGRDKALIAILKGDERKVAEIPVERHENAVRREALAMPDSGGPFGRSYYPGGGNFFSRLFGAPEPPPPPAQPQRKRASQNRTEIH